jgi:hypothetical protein
MTHLRKSNKPLHAVRLCLGLIAVAFFATTALAADKKPNVI